MLFAGAADRVPKIGVVEVDAPCDGEQTKTIIHNPKEFDTIVVYVRACENRKVFSKK